MADKCKIEWERGTLQRRNVAEMHENDGQKLEIKADKEGRAQGLRTCLQDESFIHLTMSKLSVFA